jgi:hypothetical protein
LFGEKGFKIKVWQEERILVKNVWDLIFGEKGLRLKFSKKREIW